MHSGAGAIDLPRRCSIPLITKLSYVFRPPDGDVSLKDASNKTVLDEQLETMRVEALERNVAELEEAVAARDAFLAVAAHELRNPMTPILAHVQRLRRLVEPQGETGTDLISGLDRLEVLVEHYVRRATVLLDVSRMTSGKLSLRNAPFDLAQLLRDVAETLAPAALYVGSTIAVDAPDELVVDSDRMAMEQVLDNLISNAIKYGLGRPIALSLHIEAGEIVLNVRDHGQGISAADRSRIFGRFERAVSQGSVIGGFGVGLWVVGQLADAMGAAIQVQSVPNEGTTFTLRLPHHGMEQQ